MNSNTEETSRMLEDIRPFLDMHKKPGITGIILYGGWGRGEQQADSDVDIGIVCENPEVLNAFKAEYDNNWLIKQRYVEPAYYNYQYLDDQSLPKRCTETFGHFWTEDARLNWSTGTILYDPEGKLQKLIKVKTILPDDERRANLDTLLWIISRNLNYRLPRFLRVEKFAEAQLLMTGTIKSIIHYIYNQNGLLMPYEEAAFYWFYKNNLPGKHLIIELFKHADADRQSCQLRLSKFWQVCQELEINVKHQSTDDFCKDFFGAKDWQD